MSNELNIEISTRVTYTGIPLWTLTMSVNFEKFMNEAVNRSNKDLKAEHTINTHIIIKVSNIMCDGNIGIQGP